MPLEFTKTPDANFYWKIGESFGYMLYVKKTWYNRLKWFIATKLFLPGTYKWL